MLNLDDFYMDFEESAKESYSDNFYEWNAALMNHTSPRFLDTEELSEIVEIYLNESEYEKAQQTIAYALQFYPEDEDLIYDILLLLNDFELWNDLLALAEKYKDRSNVWADGHRVSALLHLGMEDVAFLSFQQLKKKYDKDEENLSILYQAMTEAMIEVDLYEASLSVIEEATRILGENVDYCWLQAQAYLLMDEKAKVLDVTAKIERLNPLDGETWFRLGRLYDLDLGESEKAVEAYEFAESLHYTDSFMFMRLVSIFEKNENYKKALEKAQECLNLYPDNNMVNVMAASVCSKMEKWEEALHYINTALKRAPKMASLYLYKSSFLSQIGEAQQAKHVLEEGIKRKVDVSGTLQTELEKLQEQYPDN